MAPLPSAPEQAELRELLSAQPPAFLDELVKARVSDVLAERREGLRASATGPAPSRIRSIEAWAYACGFFAYGAQLVDGLARSILRAMLG